MESSFDRWLDMAEKFGGADSVKPARVRDAAIVTHDNLDAAERICESVFGKDKFKPEHVIAVFDRMEVVRQGLVTKGVISRRPQWEIRSNEDWIGRRVRHERFGEGDVVEARGEGSKSKLTINFDAAGPKVVTSRFVESIARGDR